MVMQRGLWLMASFVFFCCSSTTNFVVNASITIVDSGRTYSSKMDKVNGIKLVDGMRYPARLQQIPGNEHLCYDNSKYQNWNITIPTDDYPGTYISPKKSSVVGNNNNSIVATRLPSFSFVDRGY